MRTSTQFWHNKNFATNFLREMDQMFDNFSTPELSVYDERRFSPVTDIEDQETYFLMSLDLPGMKQEDIKIEVVDKVLTISGERKRDLKLENKPFSKFERHYGSFERSFSLPATVDVSKIEASYESGVLELYLPKAELAQPKKIEIQSNKGGFFGQLIKGEKKEANTPSSTIK